MVHPDNGIFFRTKKNELLSHAKALRKLRSRLLSERSHNCVIPTRRHSGNAKNCGDTKKVIGYEG